MRRYFSHFILAIIVSFLIGCKNGSDNRRNPENSGENATVKNDTVSASKTDSLARIKTGAKTKQEPSEFHRVLTFKNIAFSVQAKGKGALQQVTIHPSGLTATNREESLETEPVVGTEIHDLNADGFPELLIFTQSAGSGSYGNVIAYSVNKGKSMSRVTFPETTKNQAIKKGYGGHDKFKVVENKLTQEFPIYREGDANANPTGKKRVITYKLQDGEASRIFVVDEVKEIGVK